MCAYGKRNMKAYWDMFSGAVISVRDNSGRAVFKKRDPPPKKKNQKKSQRSDTKKKTKKDLSHFQAVSVEQHCGVIEGRVAGVWFLEIG